MAGARATTTRKSAPASSGRRYSGLSPEERVQLRRQQLLDAALELFATQGYTATTIEQICQSALVGLKGFYDEFATKEQLLLALFDQLVANMFAEVAAKASGLEGDEANVRTILKALLTSMARDVRVARVLFLESTGVSMTIEARRQGVHRDISRYIESWYDSGVFGAPVERHMPPRVSLGVAGGILEVLRDWLVDPAGDDIDALADDLDQFCRVFLAGLGADRQQFKKSTY